MLTKVDYNVFFKSFVPHDNLYSRKHRGYKDAYLTGAILRLRNYVATTGDFLGVVVVTITSRSHVSNLWFRPMQNAPCPRLRLCFRRKQAGQAGEAALDRQWPRN